MSLIWMIQQLLMDQFLSCDRKWNRTSMLMSITEAVHDIAYAPNLGRSYDVLAIATKDVVIMRFDK